MSRLLIVSNRLPLTVQKPSNGGGVEISSGGLVTALRSVVRQREGCWIGWAGTDRDPAIERRLRTDIALDSCRMVPLFLSKEEHQDFYCGFCNEILWPLFHDLQSRCNFEPAYWQRYLKVNARFADVVCSEAKPGDLVWIHDYHLMLQGKLLSGRIGRKRLMYFHHIPFPPADVFEKLPWRLEILESLLSFGTVGFQTIRDRRNFIGCVRRFLPAMKIRRSGFHLSVGQNSDRAVVGAFPIGIDFNEFAGLATKPEVVQQREQVRKNLKNCRIVLGVDRLDYTKGIPERLKAFRNLLTRYPGLHRNISLIQIVVPSREDIPKYQELKMQVERLVTEINGHFGRTSWVPVHYQHRHLSREELVAYYCAADIALITPLKDGMNLVAKEFCASRVDEKGVLVLSEFAGAASQLRTGALLVNPYDTEKVASAIYEAFHMSPAEVQRRMRRMRRRVSLDDVHRWCSQFFEQGSLIGMDDDEEALEDTPQLPRGERKTTLAAAMGEQ